MSAFMVSKEHIDAIVGLALYGPADLAPSPAYWLSHGVVGERLDRESATELGQALVDENLKSIWARYPDTVDATEGTPGPIERYWELPYAFEVPGRYPTAVEGLKLLACFEYQSCEHAEWNESRVKEFCDSLRHSLIDALPGYDEAPWEWTEVAARKA